MKTETAMELLFGAFVLGAALGAQRGFQEGYTRGYGQGHMDGSRRDSPSRWDSPADGRRMGMKMLAPADEPVLRLEDFPEDRVTRCPPGVAKGSIVWAY